MNTAKKNTLTNWILIFILVLLLAQRFRPMPPHYEWTSISITREEMEQMGTGWYRPGWRPYAVASEMTDNGYGYRIFLVRKN